MKVELGIKVAAHKQTRSIGTMNKEERGWQVVNEVIDINRYGLASIERGQYLAHGTSTRMNHQHDD